MKSILFVAFVTYAAAIKIESSKCRIIKIIQRFKVNLKSLYALDFIFMVLHLMKQIQTKLKKILLFMNTLMMELVVETAAMIFPEQIRIILPRLTLVMVNLVSCICCNSQFISI